MEDGVTPQTGHLPCPPEVWSRPIHRLFEEVVERFPARTAVVCGGERVVYRELNERANAVAAALLGASLPWEAPVAVAVPKSVAQIAAILGVLKAGGAYVPVVTNQPDERLRRIVRDARCRHAIVSPGYADPVLEAVPIRIDPSSLPASGQRDPALNIGPGHLAYIMYTSGSTGEPKGAMIEHAGVVRLVHGQDYMPFGPDLHFLYGGPLSFDLSTIEIFTPLLHGAKLLISQDQVLSPETIRRFAEQDDLRAVCISFSLFRALFEADAGAFERLPVIGVCGEPADARFIREAQGRLPNAAFYNAYGPTECAALSTTHQIHRPCPLEPAVVPIGTPLRGMSVRVLDDAGRPVSPGEKGELVIGGLGVGRGYLNDPALTAAKFISGPRSPSERWYRSGDLVRVRADGVIAYEGRLDDQIKIRGQRIELGEIDAAMSADPFIKAAASVVVGSGESARVGACVVPRDLLAFEAAALVSRLARRLTPAMLPSVLVPVESIPINANGKIDRTKVRGLIEEYGSHSPGEGSIPPSAARPAGTENERLLLRVLEPILGGNGIDLERSWAHSGGDSLRAMVLRIRLRERAGLEVTVAAILAAPSLRDLAAGLRHRSSATDPDEFPATPEGPVPVSPAQRRLWTVQQIDPGSGAYNVAYRFAFRKPPDRPALEAAWRDLHRRHPALRERFEPDHSGEPRGLLLDSVVCDVAWDVRFDDPSIVRNRITEPFDLTKPPLTRLLVGAGPAEPSGILVMHHIITDAWSMDVMLRDLEALYRHHRDGVATGLPRSLPGAPAQAAWLDQRLRAGAFHAAAEAAAGSFRGAAPTYALLESEGEDFGRAETTVVPIPAELRGLIGLQAASPRAGPHAVLLACFAPWAAELCGTDEPAIGLAFSHRDDGPFADAVGFFVETVPVRFSVSPAPFRELVSRAQSAVEEGHARRLIPFDLIARLAGSPGTPGRTPITEVFFNVIDPAPVVNGSESDREIEPDPIEVDHGLARFDLLCTVYGSHAGWRLSVTARRGRWHGREGCPTASELLDRMKASLSGEESSRRVGETGAGAVAVRSRARPVDAGDPVIASIKWTIVSVFRSVLGNQELGPDDDFFQSGGDSLRALRAFGMIRQAHPTSLTTAAMFRYATASALAERIHADESGHSDQPFMWFSEPDRPRTAYVFPGVTGDALSMRAMLGALGGDWSIRAAMYPGTTSDREPFDSLASLVEYFLPAMTEGPPSDSVLIGYSFGGVLAYELATRLQSSGRTPGRLVLIDTALMRRFPVREGTLPLSVHLERFWGHGWSGRKRQIARVPAGLLRRLRDLVGPEERYDRLPAIRRLSSAHLRAIRGYSPSGPYEGRVLMIRAIGQGRPSPQADDPTNGWGPYLSRAPDVVDLPTDHVGLMKSSAAADVARAIVQAVGMS
jgi:amino acid adenylation domain-containing protein